MRQNLLANQRLNQYLSDFQTKRKVDEVYLPDELKAFAWGDCACGVIFSITRELMETVKELMGK